MGLSVNTCVSDRLPSRKGEAKVIFRSIINLSARDLLPRSLLLFFFNVDFGCDGRCSGACSDVFGFR